MTQGNAVTRCSAVRAFAILVTVVCAVLVTSLFTANVALADEGTGKTPVSSSSFSMRLGNDIVWAGDIGTLNGDEVANDVLSAGRVINIDASKVGGSIRAAAQSISLKNTEVVESVTIAGEILEIEGGHANDVVMASRSASFKGEANGLHVYAETAYIDGVVHGDATVMANSVEIGPNAEIEGTLHVTSSAEPPVDAQAKVGKLDVKIEEGNSLTGQQAQEAFAGLATSMIILGLVFSILGTFIIAVLSEWLFKRHTAAAAEMIRERTGATIGSGIIGALVAPIAIIILFCFVITIPVAGALALALIAMSLVATGFAGASLFKLVFKNMGRFKAALLGGAIMGVASAVPFLGSLVSAAAFMYFLGYVLQTIFLSMRKSNADL